MGPGQQTERPVFEFTLTSLSSSGEIVSSASAFADEPDTNTQDNTVIAVVSEFDLNIIPTFAHPLPDRSLSATVATTFPLAGYFEDGDGDPLTFVASGLPQGLSINMTTGNITGTPSASDVGNTFMVTVTATDNFSASVSDSFDISITPAPSPPAPPPSSGGGGGSFGLLSLAALCCLARRRRIRAEQSGRRRCDSSNLHDAYLLE